MTCPSGMRTRATCSGGRGSRCCQGRPRTNCPNTDTRGRHLPKMRVRALGKGWGRGLVSTAVPPPASPPQGCARASLAHLCTGLGFRFLLVPTLFGCDIARACVTLHRWHPKHFSCTRNSLGGHSSVPNWTPTDRSGGEPVKEDRNKTCPIGNMTGAAETRSCSTKGEAPTYYEARPHGIAQ